MRPDWAPQRRRLTRLQYQALLAEIIALDNPSWTSKAYFDATLAELHKAMGDR